MSTLPQTYIGFGDGASHSTQNLTFVALIIYVPTDELVSIHGICLGQTTNNIAEYSTVIELLFGAILFCIR